ncbi:MAG TPA: hypothetical protein VI544_01145 [Candidatus Nanoarchaeia archaeon]|nr:hypothetical protein [Candidatus Nanoarchaeia archaeon]
MEENKKEEIREQAKAILANFAKSLEKSSLSLEKKGTSGRKKLQLKKEIGGFREEGAPSHPDEDFRKRVFDNALNKDEDFIIAEKAKW